MLANVAVARLQSIMNTFLLRRKKDSMLDGEILVNLPPKKVELIKLEFSEEEREIYNMVRLDPRTVLRWRVDNSLLG